MNTKQHQDPNRESESFSAGESLAPLPGDASAVQIFSAIEASFSEVRFYLDLTAKISEGWTVGEHTLLALSLADNYPFQRAIQRGYEEGRWGISAESFVKGFALHDCGKFIPGADEHFTDGIQSARAAGNMDEATEIRNEYQAVQHQRVVEYLLPKYQAALGLGDQELAVMESLIAGDEVGNLFVRSVNGRPDFDEIRDLWSRIEDGSLTLQRYNETVQGWEQYWIENNVPELESALAEQAALSIYQKAEKLGMRGTDLLDLKLIYAQMDMSAYTAGAKLPALHLQGKSVMDHYFARSGEAVGEFVWDASRSRLQFSKPCAEKVERIYESLNDLGA